MDITLKEQYVLESAIDRRLEELEEVIPNCDEIDYHHYLEEKQTLKRLFNRLKRNK